MEPARYPYLIKSLYGLLMLLPQVRLPTPTHTLRKGPAAVLRRLGGGRVRTITTRNVVAHRAGAVQGMAFHNLRRRLKSVPDPGLLLQISETDA